MLILKEYIGHIRNWKQLCDELGIDSSLSRKKREELIILKGCETWGAKLPEHIFGMFAFAVWDDEQEKLFCVRDQFGTKPFYYYETKDNRLLFGTLIRDIINQPGFVKELNEDMLQIYLTMTYAPGENTFFKGVKKLMPGCFLEWTAKDGVKITRYWKPEFKPETGKSLQDFADEINEKMAEIMPQVLEDGEEADSFLSGGVDSSYVFALSKAKNADTIGYDDERFDESRLASQTADMLGRTISVCKIQPEQYFKAVPEVMENMEQPLADASAIVFAIGAKATAEHTKICYSGEGSDEFFGGYNMYRNAERYGDNLKTFYVGNSNIMKEDEKERLLKNYNPDFLPIDIVKSTYDEIEDYDPLSKMCSIDIQYWLEGDIYLNVDKMSRAAGLEVRMPLTDLRIFDIASRMPSEYKINAEQNKVAFRTAAAKHLPEEVAFRKKLGFIVPIRIWMADDRYNASVREALADKSAEKFFNKEEIQKIWREYKEGNSDLWRKIWVIYTFLIWYDIYFKE